MPITVVVGGQFGSEGKGKIVAYRAATQGASLVVRCGSTNSGHTVWHGGERYQCRMIPTAFVQREADLAIAPGALIDVNVLRKEIERTCVPRERLYLDRNAMVIESGDIAAEARAQMHQRFGSTQSGVGQAVARRALRSADVRTVRDIPELCDIAIVCDVSELVNRRLAERANVVIEGTQGYGLSLYHTPSYPYATSRDTTAAAFLSEVGVGPRAVEEVILCVRTFPIRVGGNSGPLPNEISWDEVTRRSGSPESIIEYTTVTQRPRRVAEFDIDFVKRAAVVNSATSIALHGADYLDAANRSARHYDELAPETKTFVEWIERETGVPVSFIGVGPLTHETIERRDKSYAANAALSAARA